MRGRAWAWCLLSAVLILGALGVSVPPYRRARHLEACQQNLKNLGTALDMYSSDNGGRFPFGPGSTWGRSPRDLPRLVGKYIDHIPTCPAAGRDTYSESYSVGYSPDAYSISCSGSAHPGLEADFPRYEWWCGLTLESPDRVWPMGGTLPPGVELDGVAMVTIMEQKQQRLAMAEQWQRAMAEHRVPPQMAEPYSERADATGKTVTSLKGSFCEGDPASRVLEVLGTPTGRTQNGFEETSLIYVDKATSNTLTIYLAKGKVRGQVRLERPWVSAVEPLPPRPSRPVDQREVDPWKAQEMPHSWPERRTGWHTSASPRTNDPRSPFARPTSQTSEKCAPGRHAR